MKLSPADLSALVELAISAAREAGEMIAQSRPETIEHKDGGASLASQVVTEIDRRSEDIILDIILPTLDRFELGLLTEEQDDDGSRFVADYFWCIDPLDGTLPFIDGRPGYSVSIALVGRDGTPAIGVTYDPVEQTMFHASAEAGAFQDGETWPTALQVGGEVLSVFADRSFLGWDGHDETVEALGRVATDMGLTGVHLDTSGAAVVNACRVLDNSPACYFKFPGPAGGGSLWDFAATACLFNEVGAIATDIFGDPLDLNRTDSTFMNHRGILFATDEALASRLRALYPN